MLQYKHTTLKLLIDRAIQMTMMTGLKTTRSDLGALDHRMSSCHTHFRRRPQTLQSVRLRVVPPDLLASSVPPLYDVIPTPAVSVFFARLVANNCRTYKQERPGSW
jgi:hypothetical protein